MPATVNDVGTKSYTLNALGTKDYTFTVSSGSNLALVCTVVFGSALDPSSISAVWDQGGTNQNMTQLIVQTNSGVGTCVIFGLRAPTVVTNGTLRVTWTTTQTDTFIDAICVTGVEQSSDGAAFPHTAGTNTTGVMTVSLTSATGNIAVGCQIPSNPASGVTGTQLYKDGSSGSWINASAEYDAGASTVTIGATGAGNGLAIAAVDVAAVSGGAAQNSGMFFGA